MNEAKIKRLIEEYKRQNLTERQINNRLKKEEEKELAERNQKPVKTLTITIEWKKSKTWGSNPHASVEVHYADGTFGRSEGYKCSGCGYDKESTVVAHVFNDYLKYKLWDLEDKDVSQKPYGIYLNYLYSPYYDGGIGMSSYYSIAKFIGGELIHVASGKSFDVYTLKLK